MKIPVQSRLANATFCNSFQYGNLLFDLQEDPEQLCPLDDAELEARMIRALIAKMQESDAPDEQYERLGLQKDVVYSPELVLSERAKRPGFESFPVTKDYQWEPDAKHIFIGMLSLIGEERLEEYFSALRDVMEQTGDSIVKRKHFEMLAKKFYSKDEGKIFYFINKLARIR